LETGHFLVTGSYFDLPAIIIVAIITAILVKGIKESATSTRRLLSLNLSIVLFVIVVGVFYINPENWQPFAPYGYTGISFFGYTLFGQTGSNGVPLGMLAGAAIIFLCVHRLRFCFDAR